MPEAFVSTKAITRNVSRAVKAGQLRKLASRLYTLNLTDNSEQIVHRNFWRIVASYFPGAVIADRTALENKPAADGSVCLVTDATRDVMLPGAVLRPRPGHAPLDTDRPFIHGLFLSSTARAYLDNMRPSRARSGLLPRSLTRREIEERLDTMIRRGGEEGASRLRDEARAIADSLDMAKEFAELDSLIGTLLGTRDAKLYAPAAVARKRRRPFDPQRLELFATLQDALRQFPPLARAGPSRSSESRATLAFFEAYFSNFIEGTEFAVKEAADIVFNNVIPADRPDDAHDILGTWRIASNDGEIRHSAGLRFSQRAC